MEKVLNILKENSGLDNINENDIALVPKMLGNLIDEKYNTSLCYQICEVRPLKSAQGAVFASIKKANSNEFKIIRKDVYTKIVPLDTGFTKEVVDDTFIMFNKDIKAVTNLILTGSSNLEENTTIITLMDQEAETQPFLQLSNSQNFEIALQEITKKVAESVLKMNRKTYKTLDSFCVLSAEFAASVLGSYAERSEGEEKLLFVGRIGRCDFYVNPFPGIASQYNQDFDIDYEIAETSSLNYAYVGLQSKKPGDSSLIFCPHSYETRYVTDPGTANINLFTYNRYGLTISPLHRPTEGNSMLHKFEIKG